MSGRSWTAGAVRATPARLVMPIVAAERKHERPRAASPRALPQRRRRARAGEPCETARRTGGGALSRVGDARSVQCPSFASPPLHPAQEPPPRTPVLAVLQLFLLRNLGRTELTIDLPLHTLATPLQLLRSPRWNGRVRVKRDDLLHGGLGSKTRKYDTLIPRLRAQGVQRVAVVTSPFGSNAFAAPSMLLPHRFQVHLIHPETRSVSRSRCTRAENLVGNALLSSMLVPQPHRHWFPHAQLEESVARLLASWTAEDGGRSVVLPEGLTVRDALRGAVQLGREVAEQAPTAPEIFVDAGTGHTAAGVIFALHTLGHPACVTVVGPCAPTDDPGASFARKLQRWHADFVAIALEELGQRARGASGHSPLTLCCCS